jgi:uncharacterized membrane protein
MGDYMLTMIEHALSAIALFAMAVITVGFAVAVWHYVRRFRETTQENNFNLFKVELGDALLLGMEILVLVEVIKTITLKPTFRSMAFLLVIIVIRTAVSWALKLQTEGRWPWQVPTKDRQNG